MDDPDPRFPCPGCGHLIFRKSPDSDDICPTCFRQDDNVQLRSPDFAGGSSDRRRAGAVVIRPENESTWEPGRKDDGILQGRYLEDFQHGLKALSGLHPEDEKVIASYGIVAALDDDDAFVILLHLVGPEAPAYADELWQLISMFLNNRRADELFGSPDVDRPHLNAVKRPRYTPPTTRPVIPQ